MGEMNAVAPKPAHSIASKIQMKHVSVCNNPVNKPKSGGETMTLRETIGG
jgi:hypothetical protein